MYFTVNSCKSTIRVRPHRRIVEGEHVLAYESGDVRLLYDLQGAAHPVHNGVGAAGPELWPPAQERHRILLLSIMHLLPSLPLSASQLSPVTIFVDDGTLCCVSELLMDWFMLEIQKHIPKVTLVRQIQKYIGINVEYNRDTSIVELSQSSYIDDKFKDVEYVEQNIPMCPSYNLQKELPNPAYASLLPITGTLRYLYDRCRFDILCATGKISYVCVVLPAPQWKTEFGPPWAGAFLEISRMSALSGRLSGSGSRGGPDCLKFTHPIPPTTPTNPTPPTRPTPPTPLAYLSSRVRGRERHPYLAPSWFFVGSPSSFH
jgi:hypothetical protein